MIGKYCTRTRFSSQRKQRKQFLRLGGRRLGLKILVDQSGLVDGNRYLRLADITVEDIAVSVWFKQGKIGRLLKYTGCQVRD
jgi:hypothetical protein